MSYFETTAQEFHTSCKLMYRVRTLRTLQKICSLSHKLHLQAKKICPKLPFKFSTIIMCRRQKPPCRQLNALLIFSVNVWTWMIRKKHTVFLAGRFNEESSYSFPCNWSRWFKCRSSSLNSSQRTTVIASRIPRSH